MSDQADFGHSQPNPPSDADTNQLRMLVVGTVGYEPRKIDINLTTQKIVFANFSEISTKMLRLIRPDVVLSTLIGDHFDAMDLAVKLKNIGFSGRYRAVTLGLPDPDLIRSEVHFMAPDLDFDVYQMDT